MPHLPSCLNENHRGAIQYIVFLVGQNGNAVPLSWRSRKVKRAVRSTLSAETLASDESAIQSFYLKQVLAETIDLSAEEL